MSVRGYEVHVRSSSGVFERVSSDAAVLGMVSRTCSGVRGGF